MTFRPSMNSNRRGLLNGALVNPKLFILEKVNFGQHTKCWSNIVKSSQTWSNVLQTCIIWYGSLHVVLNRVRHAFNNSYILLKTSGV